MSFSMFWNKIPFSPQIKYEVIEDVYTSRKKQHQTAMHYFCALNTLQYKKKIAMLEPLLGYIQAQVNVFGRLSFEMRYVFKINLLK